MIRKKLLRTLVSGAILLSAATPALADNGSTFAANRTDFRDESIYFLMTTRFYDGDPANNVLCWDNQQAQISTKDPCWRGDFAGIIRKLDYIKALGFTAIWITPVVQNASGYDYHGYHAMDFSRVDCRYLSRTSEGSDSDVDFKTLIDAAHSRGIKVILDIVLNHTGNFGEEHLMKEFTRDARIRNQADLNACMLPNYDVLPSDYLANEKTQYQRRLALMKNTDGQNHDRHNYWHHVANAWNWDEPSRWWGQIAGDCVDLNTENPAVSDYLVRCYGEFIKLGVDGFRIDTSGHISRLTFNKAFIPQFEALGRQYASARRGEGLGQAPFYMFGEVCARFGGVTYRDQPNLSPYYYTWKSDASALAAWNDDASWWDAQHVSEGAEPLGNMTLCLAEPNVRQSSDNAHLAGGAYHTPDYSQASGFHVIDFPVHYNFTNAGSAMNMTREDHLYNDATWNVVYVDSHDYSPQPNDGIRFAGGTDQWAENLTWMFFFRGIPCIYYGSEVEFMKGAPIDKGPNGPLSATGRAYFGQNLEGEVTATDFGRFTASGQVAKTLAHPLARHLERLNRIRQAVPALRKGQYSTEGCTSQGGWAWKKAYRADGVDSYACVAMQGNATFTGIPDGVYVDCVTGQSQTVTGGTLSVSCPGNQGNARVYVLRGPGKIGDDSPFLYGTAPGTADNSSLPADPGATRWYGRDDVVGTAGLKLEPRGGAFTSESQTVSVTLNDVTGGWYTVNGGERVSVTGPTTFTLGGGDAAGTTYHVEWGATAADGSGEVTGEATYNKVGVYTPALARADERSVFYETDARAVGIWVWADAATNFTGGNWDKKPNMDFVGVTAQGRNVYKWTYRGTTATMPTGVIFLPDGRQSADLTYSNHGYYVDDRWDHEVTTVAGGGEVVPPTPDPEPDPTPVEPETQGLHAYFVNDCGWTDIHAWVWQGSNSANNYTGGSWPGQRCTATGRKTPEGYDIWQWVYSGSLAEVPGMKIIFNNGRGGQGNQTSDLDFTSGGYYNLRGVTSGIGMVPIAPRPHAVCVYSLSGQLVRTAPTLAAATRGLPAGIYVTGGRKVIVR